MMWDWPIAVYLFLGGLGGGLFAMVAGLEAYGLTKPLKRTISWGAGLSWVFIIVGMGFLVIDLGRPERGIWCALCILKW